MIKTNTKDNKKDVKMNIIGKGSIVLLSTIMVTIGSGMQQAKAQTISENDIREQFFQMGVENNVSDGIQWDMEKQYYFVEGQKIFYEEQAKLNKQKLKEAGYQFFFTGEIPEGVEWNEELKEYWNQGIQEAMNSGIENAKWEKIGYDFISKGKLSEEMDYGNKVAGKLALQRDAYQKGIEKALEEGNIVDVNEIEVLDPNIENPTPAQQNLEEYRKMLAEGWVKMGKESIDDLHYFDNKSVSSLSDDYFKTRGMNITASKLVNAGIKQALLERENALSIENISNLVKNEKISDLKEIMNKMIEKENEKYELKKDEDVDIQM